MPACRRYAATLFMLAIGLTLTPALQAQIVTPDGGTTTALPGTTDNIATFTLTNNLGGFRFYTFTCSVSGQVTACTPPELEYALDSDETVSLDVIYSAGATGTGNVTLTATNTGGVDTGDYNVSVLDLNHLVASTDFTVNDNQNMGLCAASCFAATQAISTVPYFSLDQPRNVTLVYHGDRVAVRPFVYADVSLTAGHAAATRYWMEVRMNGTLVTFLNGANSDGSGGETRLKFTVPSTTSTTVRLGGQFDATAYATSGTNMYSLQITAGVDYASSTDTRTIDTKILIVDERKSPIARGWTVAGVQRLYVQTTDNSVLITDGSGSAQYFATCGGTDCFTAPRGDFTSLTATGSGTSKVFTRAYPDSTKVRFNYLGRMSSVTDPFGNAVTFSYDGSGRLTNIEDPIRTYMHYNSSTGLWVVTKANIALVYGSYGLTAVNEILDYLFANQGRSTTIALASDSTLTTFTDPDGIATRFGYDAARRLASVVGRRGDTTAKYVYDPRSWKLDSAKTPNVAIDNGSGDTTRVTLTSDVSPWQTVGIPTSATSGTPKPYLKPDTVRARITDAGGHTSSFTVDRWGQPVASTDPVGRVTTAYRVTWPNLLPDSVRNAWGAVDKFTWNPIGLPLTQQSAGRPVVSFRYNAGYAVADSIWTTGRPSEKRFISSANGRIDSVKVYAGASTFLTKYTFDSRGRVLSVNDPGNHTSTVTYDAVFGNTASTSTPGSTSNTLVDGYGRDTASWATGVPRLRTRYDSLNRVRATKIGADSTVYSYDALFLTQVRDPKAQNYGYTYNAAGWATSESHPDPAKGSRKTRYNIEGLVTAWTNRRGETVIFTYDALHRRLVKAGTNVVPDTMSYSTDGKIAVSSNAYARDSVFVDSTGWADSLATRFTPFSNNQRRFRRHYTKTALYQPEYVYIQGGITGGLNPVAFATRRYEWHATTGLLSRATVNGSGPDISRNGELQQSGVVMPSGAAATVGHSTTHAPFSVRWSGTAMDNLERSYGLGDAGRVTKEIKPHYQSQDYQRSFSYDSLGRHTQVRNALIETSCEETPPNVLLGYICSGTVETPLDSSRYRYDAAHNRIADTVWVPGAVTTDALVYSTGNRLTNRTGYTYTYDLDGNLTKKVRTAGPDSVLYTWSADGLLRQVTSGSLTVAYDYDAGGKLVRKSRNGVLERHFLWDRGQMIAELDGNATARIGEYAYYPGADQPLALITGATTVTATRYYQQDGMGNVIGLYTSNDAVVFTQEYASWGSVGGITPNTARDTSKLRWKGLMFEGDSAKLYYMRARWYDPEAGRFVSEDPIGLAGGINQYAFAAGDPVNGWDPSGLACRTIGVDRLECTDISAGDFATIRDFLGGAAGQAAYELFARAGWTGGGSQSCPNVDFASRCNQIRDKLSYYANSPAPLCKTLGSAGVSRYGRGQYNYSPTRGGARGQSLSGGDVIILEEAWLQNLLSFVILHEEYHQYLIRIFGDQDNRWKDPFPEPFGTVDPRNPTNQAAAICMIDDVNLRYNNNSV